MSRQEMDPSLSSFKQGRYFHPHDIHSPDQFRISCSISMGIPLRMCSETPSAPPQRSQSPLPADNQGPWKPPPGEITRHVIGRSSGRTSPARGAGGRSVKIKASRVLTGGAGRERPVAARTGRQNPPQTRPLSSFRHTRAGDARMSCGSR